MRNKSLKYVYGAVPSRRLGRSLGIDLVPFKTCTYDCIYCQLGRTTNKTIERREYVSIDEVLAELDFKLAQADNADYISIAGSGEPTLNSNIGTLIDRIKELTKIPVAVLTNGSLLWIKEVREALMSADLVIPSLDAGDERLFRYVNRPHPGISFERVIDGIAEFTNTFPGKVWMEIFLLAGVTGIESEAKKIAAIVKRAGPARIQLNTVSRPPAEDFAIALTTAEMLALKNSFGNRVEIIGERELTYSQARVHPDRTEEDILALLRRRPCTSMDLAKGLGVHITEIIKHMDHLINAEKVALVVAERNRFYTLKRSE